MEGFTIVDAIVALVIIVSALLAYSRGFVREGMAIAGWIVAAILGYIFAPHAVPLVKEIPMLGGYIEDSCELAVIAGFFSVFALALIVVSIFTPLLSSAVQRSALGGIDQGLGFFFGVIRGILLVAIALVIVDRISTGDRIAVLEDSRTVKVFDRSQSRLDDSIPENAPGWITSRYESLVSTCTE
ncbi:CvpA family protein [Pacificibacter marinus]|uniref:Colicin V production protein n=1 Tax=Pacificibacter marinus TaxID=658057 RepID=A0A1Y5SMM0_9RHOB|nr:CvpA family protein [Pacificibacter marinus]SEK71553.1 membrane protein required for colicin V production [Pacificibacter marinus]SLN44213.1 colicin V production protein [Pacificibacter marinus]